MKISTNRSKWIVFLLAMLIFGQSINNGYVWDDFEYISVLKLHLQENLLTKVFSEPFYISSNYYRPITLYTILFEARLSGASALLSHLINVVIHGLNGLLIFTVCKRTAELKKQVNDKSTYLPLLMALFFICHPAMIESVTWISGRFDLLVTTFSLLTLLFLLRLRSCYDAKHVFATGVFFLAGAMSKEMIVVLPLAALFLFYLRDRLLSQNASILGTFRSNIRLFLPIAISGCIYLLIRYFALGHIIDLGEGSEYDIQINFGQKIQLILSTVGAYFLKLVYPFVGLSALHPYDFSKDWFNSELLSGICVVAFIFIGVFIKKITPFSILLLVYYSALLPVLNFINLPTSESYYQERFMTLPIAFFCCAIAITIVGYNINIAVNTTKPALVLIAGWFVISCAVIVTSTPLWKSNFSLWAWQVKVNPQLFVVNQNFAVELSNRGRPVEAIPYYERAYNKIPNVVGMSRVAQAYLDLKNYELAYQAFLKLENMDLTAKSYQYLLKGVSKSLICLRKTELAEFYISEMDAQNIDDRAGYFLRASFYSLVKLRTEFNVALDGFRRFASASEAEAMEESYGKGILFGC
ncbi:MAG: tetratricopeptide repeat protein [Gammaproteobacteria bacterium]|nr:tetratricopeptide repeat protein [Gammaproteobacteria bacterium]